LSDIWKIVERIEQLADHIEDINDYLDKVHETHLAYNVWINQATENILELSKEIRFIKNKKTCI
jgi:hypothetical protein